MRIEIIYMDRNKATSEFECDEVFYKDEFIVLENVFHPFEAPTVRHYLNDVDYVVEYTEEEEEAEVKE